MELKTPDLGRYSDERLRLWLRAATGEIIRRGQQREAKLDAVDFRFLHMLQGCWVESRVISGRCCELVCRNCGVTSRPFWVVAWLEPEVQLVMSTDTDRQVEAKAMEKCVGGSGCAGVGK